MKIRCAAPRDQRTIAKPGGCGALHGLKSTRRLSRRAACHFLSVFWLIASTFLLFSICPVEARQTPSVIILVSYHPGFAWSEAELEGLKERLSEGCPGIDPYVEYLDAKRHPDGDSLSRMKNFLRNKYSGKKPDLVICLDNPALHMILDYRNELFKDIPIVFAGISGFNTSLLRSHRGVTGIAETQDMKETLEDVLRLHPGTREILLIEDYTLSGSSSRQEAEALMPMFAGRVNIRFLPPVTFEEAVAEISSLSAGSIALIHSFATDRSGRSLSLAESTRLFTAASRVPVYSLHESRLGHGIVGGRLLGGREHGRRAGDIALRVLAGEDPDSIPVVTESTARPAYDYIQLRRFGISLKSLPEGSTVVNKPVTVWESHREFVYATAAVVAVLLSMVVLLVFAIVRRRRAEESLRKYEYIVSASHDLLALINRKYIYEAANSSFLAAHQCSKEEAIGRTVPEIIGESVFEEKVRPRLDRAFAGEIVHYREQFDLNGPGRRTFDVTYYPFLDDSAVPAAVVLHSRDMTDRLLLEEKLMQAQKMESIGTLASGVAHEINNPINGIMNYAQLIIDRSGKGNPATEPATEIIEEANRVAKIVRNLLTFARHEKQSHSPAQLADIADSALSLIRTVMRHDQIDLKIDIPEGLPAMKCRSQQIQQVIMNLMTNARDALNQKYPGYNADKQLLLSAQLIEKQGRKYLRTTVEDFGAGIALEIRDRIFDPFFTTKPKERGTGLGLSITYGIVKEHGGELTVESEPGQYTRFHVDLPVDNGWKIPWG
ncbi:MAG: ABC transporter substrate binding protein [Syntrophobacteraceae bacterium]